MNYKKLLRIVAMITLSPFIYVVMFLVYSMLGLVLIQLAISLCYPLAWLGDDKELMTQARRCFVAGTYFIYGPFIDMYTYIQTGKFNID